LEHSDFGLESIRDYAVELVRNTPIGLMVLQVATDKDNTEFRILSVNPAVIETVGMRNSKAEDLVGKTIREVFPSLCNQQLVVSLLEVLRRGKPRHLGEIRYGDARVSEGVFSAQAFPLPNRCLGIAVENITERKRAEDTLRASEAKFRNFLDSAPDAVVISDEHGRILLVNSQTERLFGYPREELFGRSVELLVPEQFRAQHECHRKEYLANPNVRPMGIGFELLGLHKDGREFPVEISLSALQTPEGLLVCSAIRDIAERKQAESALKRTAAHLSRSNAELEQFAYAASHDLQEPLRTVVSATQVLAKDFGDKLEPDARQWVMFATQGAKRMQTLLNALLDYARLGASRKSPERVDCRRIYETTVADLRTAIAESNAEVTADSLPVVLGDTVQLRQVFQNLIANAIKFRCNDRPPRIHVCAEQRDNEWRITIRDNGVGIDPKNFGRLFVLFQRLHSGQQYRGTGIGLAICKKIVEHHGGRIGVESVPGQGSTFYFTLPVADPQILAQIQATAKPTDTDRIFKSPG
jgi:PAS domain S-box-containing protein